MLLDAAASKMWWSARRTLLFRNMRIVGSENSGVVVQLLSLYQWVRYECFIGQFLSRSFVCLWGRKLVLP